MGDLGVDLCFGCADNPVESVLKLQGDGARVGRDGGDLGHVGRGIEAANRGCDLIGVRGGEEPRVVRDALRGTPLGHRNAYGASWQDSCDLPGGGHEGDQADGLNCLGDAIKGDRWGVSCAHGVKPSGTWVVLGASARTLVAMESCVTCASDLVCAVVGPTASGKSDLALEVACRLPGVLGAGGAGEIVSADALQLYRGMDVGTAKTPVNARRGIAHHQIDVLQVRDEASVAAYQRHARADVADIHARRGVAVVAGGSGLYQRALLDVIEFPGTDPVLRARLEEEAEGAAGSRGLHDRLKALDPVSATRINPHNTRRIVRALEVIELTGRPYSSSMPRHEFVSPALMVALRRSTESLDARIDARTRAMMDGGLIEEVRALIDEGLREAKTASRATGYAQALAVIDGIMTEDEAVDSIALATRQLARRQVKWLRPDPRVHWLDVEEFASDDAVATRVVELVEREAEAALARS